MPYDDPIVNEVRMIRERLLGEFHGDIEAYLEFLRREERKNPGRLARNKAIQPVLIRQFSRASTKG